MLHALLLLFCDTFVADGVCCNKVGAKQRQGVSQYQQPHMMLKKGLSLLEELFPDYGVKLHEAGAVKTDYLKDIVVVSNLQCLTAIIVHVDCIKV